MTFVSDSYLLLLTPYLFQVSAHVSQSVVDLKIRVEEVERVLKERENEWKETNEDTLKRVELLSKENIE